MRNSLELLPKLAGLYQKDWRRYAFDRREWNEETRRSFDAVQTDTRDHPSTTGDGGILTGPSRGHHMDTTRADSARLR